MQMESDLVPELAQRLAERRYGKYRGFVADNADPEKRGRLRLHVPTLLGDRQTDWALPCFPTGGKKGHGWFSVPEVDAQVWVEFEEGDPARPIWVGCFYQTTDDVPPQAQTDPPTTHLFQTPGGQAVRFQDKDGDEQTVVAHPSGAEIIIDNHGSIIATDAQGSQLRMDAQAQEVVVEGTNGQKVSITPSGVTVTDGTASTIELGSGGVKVSAAKVTVEGGVIELGGAGGEPVLKGSTFLVHYLTHTHTTSAPGTPTSPPIIPGAEAALSNTVTTR